MAGKLDFEPLTKAEAEKILRSRLQRFESAQIVWDALAAAGPKGLTKKQIKSKTRLTDGQVNYAFGFIKDVLMEKYEQPLAVNMQTYRYSLPPDWHEVKEYVDFRMRGILTMIRRVELVANASALKWGDEEPISTVKRRVRHLREELEAMANV